MSWSKMTVLWKVKIVEEVVSMLYNLPATRQRKHENSVRSPRDTIKEILSNTDIAINGSNPWDIQVYDNRCYSRILRDGNLGLGEAYMEGWWSCRRIDEFIHRILMSGVDEMIKGSIGFLVSYLLARLTNRQSKSRSHMIADAHYNLDNDLFMSFLDPYNQYSCGYFNDTDDLDEAQRNKLELICRKLDLRAGDRVLDIGCGWGGLAHYAVHHYDCQVAGVNISEEQIRYARDLCKGLPVKIINSDYRDVRGTYDKIVSVGMIEHVGYKNYRSFMNVAHRCMKENGIFLLHTIGGNTSNFKCDPWITKYIFPNGMLPSVAQLGKAVEGLFVMEDWHNLGPHYDRTLMAWNDNFQRAWPALKDRYDEKFKRMWEYYLLSCAGAFRARNIQLWQIVYTKAGTVQPDCRH